MERTLDAVYALSRQILGESGNPLADYDRTITRAVERVTASGLTSAVDGSLSFATSDVVNVKAFPYLAKGDGLTDDTAAIQAARDYAATAPGGLSIVFPPGTYRYTTSPNWGVGGLHVIGHGLVTLQHTGTGPACLVDGTTFGVNGVVMRDLTIQGNVNSTHGVQIAKVWRSTFENLSVKGCASTGSGFYSTYNVCNHFINPKVIAASNMPLHGMYFADSDCSANVLSHPVMEGVTGSGLKFAAGAAQTTVLGGTSESNVYGIDLAANAQRNVFVGIDLEANSTADILCAGSYNTFLGVLAGDATTLTHLLSGANFNLFSGGMYQTITLDGGALANTLVGVGYSFTAGGTFTDGGSGTQTFGLWNVNTSVVEPNTFRGITLTSYLDGSEQATPSAPSANKGRLYFDDSGGKTRLMVLFNTGAAQVVATQP